MKRSIKYIITTITICVVMVCSLSLSVFADSVSYDLDTGIVRYNNVVVPSVLTTGQYEWQSTDLPFVEAGSDFKQYVTTTDFVTYDGKNAFMVIGLSYGSEINEGLSDVNSFEVRYGLIGSAGETQVSAQQFGFIGVSLNGVSIINQMSVNYQISAPKTGVLPSSAGTFSYREVSATVLLDDNIRLRDGDTLGFFLRSRVLSFGYGLKYSFGFDPLVFTYKTTDDFIKDTAKDTEKIASTVTQISDTLNKGLTAEQQAKLEKNTQMMQDRYEQEEEIQNEYDNIQDIITSNGYDVFEDMDIAQVQQVQTNFQDTGLERFADGLWSVHFVVASIGLVLVFVGIKIGLYGL